MNGEESSWEVVIPHRIREKLSVDPRSVDLIGALEFMLQAGPGVQIGQWDPNSESYKFQLWGGGEVWVGEYVESDDDRLNWIELIDIKPYP